MASETVTRYVWWAALGVLAVFAVVVLATGTLRYVIGHHAIALIPLLLIGVAGLAIGIGMIAVGIARRHEWGEDEWGEPSGVGLAGWVVAAFCVLVPVAIGVAALAFGAHLMGDWYDEARVAVKFDDEIPGYLEIADTAAPAAGGIEDLGATKASAFAATAAPSAPPAAGGAVVVDPEEEGINDGIFFSLPEQARASSPDEAAVVAFIGYEEHEAGEYESGAVGIRESAEIVVIDPRSKAVVGTRTIWGGLPAGMTHQDAGEKEYGDPPGRQKIVDYIAGFTSQGGAP